jgi:hypothetical protein
VSTVSPPASATTSLCPPHRGSRHLPLATDLPITLCSPTSGFNVDGGLTARDAFPDFGPTVRSEACAGAPDHLRQLGDELARSAVEIVVAFVRNPRSARNRRHGGKSDGGNGQRQEVHSHSGIYPRRWDEGADARPIDTQDGTWSEDASETLALKVVPRRTARRHSRPPHACDRRSLAPRYSEAGCDA